MLLAERGGISNVRLRRPQIGSGPPVPHHLLPFPVGVRTDLRAYVFDHPLAGPVLDQNPLHFIKRHILRPPVIELGGPRRSMVRHRGGTFQRPTILEIGGDPGCPERMVSDRRLDLGRDRAPTYHLKGIGLGQGSVA